MTRYATIVADPPWDHSDGTGVKFGLGGTHIPLPDGPKITRPPYAAMTLDAIRSLPVADLAAQDAHLYLWTTNRYLRHVWDIADDWGFAGVCILTWCKARRGWLGGGAYTSDTEFCLFARRGNLKTLARGPGRWFTWPRTRGRPVPLGQERDGPNGAHSAKPEAFLDLVEQVSPGPYLELFSRRTRFGWDTWGDEALNPSQLTL